MKRVSPLVLVIFLISFLVVPTVYAGVVYDNGAPNLYSGNEMTEWIQAEDFTLATTQTINELKFWVIAGTYAGSITGAIMSDNGGSPDSILGSGNFSVTPIATGRTTSFGSEYLIDVIFPNFTANAGTRYWLALHNGNLSNIERAEFYWETTDNNGTYTGHEWELNNNSSWFDNEQEHAFQLLSTSVPEPASMLLLGLGLIGVAGIRKRMK